MAVEWNIRITDPKGRATVHKISAFPVTIGREETLPLCINDPQSSRKHCHVELRDETTLRVTDNKSTNGTVMNGKKITQAQISDGDRIKIGETILEFTRITEISVEDDTGAKRLSVLKSFAATSKGSPLEKFGKNESAILSRIGSPDGDKGALTVAHQRQALLADIARVLTEMTDRDEILKTILAGLIEVYPIDRVAILLKNPNTGQVLPVASKSRDSSMGGIIVSQTICAHVLHTEESIITEDAVADPRFSSGASIIENRIGAVVAAPISARGVVYGVLYSTTAERATKFKESDLSFIALVGNIVALAVLLDQAAPR